MVVAVVTFWLIASIRTPQIVNYGEVLGEWTITRKLAEKWPMLLRQPGWPLIEHAFDSRWFYYLAQVYSAYQRVSQLRGVNFKWRSNLSQFGIKEFAQHIIQYQLEPCLHADIDLKIIYLHRDRVFDRFLSYRLMQETNQILTRNAKSNASRKIELNIDTLLSDLSKIELENQQLKKIVSGLPQSRVFSIAYEDLFSSVGRQTSIMCELQIFLGVEHRQINSQHKKIIDHPSDKVSNFDEVVATLRGTKYELSNLSSSATGEAL